MRPVNLTASSETIFNLFSCQAFIFKADQKHGNYLDDQSGHTDDFGRR